MGEDVVDDVALGRVDETSVLVWNPGEGHEGNVLLPPMTCEIKRVSFLTGGHATITEGPIGAVLSLPAEQREEVDTIIVLDLDRSAETIPPLEW